MALKTKYLKEELNIEQNINLGLLRFHFGISIAQLLFGIVRFSMWEYSTIEGYYNIEFSLNNFIEAVLVIFMLTIMFRVVKFHAITEANLATLDIGTQSGYLRIRLEDP